MKIGSYGPALRPDQIRRGYIRGYLRITGHGLEKRCGRCGEWWPADSEFFSVSLHQTAHHISSWCRECHAEYKAERKAKEEAA